LYSAKVKVTLRKSILDPQGKAVETSIRSLGYDKVTDTRIGKYIELTLDVESEQEARRVMDEICSKLLANPVMEDYEFEITEIKSS